MQAKNSHFLLVTLHVNGEQRTVMLPANKTLLTTLRDDFHLTGTKPGCYNGDCGACTVLVDNVPMKSCLMLPAEIGDKEIITVEGIKNSAIQEAFIAHFAFQCGYCTPGFIINCYGLFLHDENPSKELIEEWLSSNICRCTSYDEIFSAINEVRKRFKENEDG